MTTEQELRELLERLTEIATRDEAKAVTVSAADLRALLSRTEQAEAERDAYKRRGDNHWETLRSIRDIARQGDCERIILWVSDAGSGYTETAEDTLAKMTDRAQAAESSLKEREDEIARLMAKLTSISKMPLSDGSEGELEISALLTDYDTMVITARSALQQEGAGK